MKRVLLLGYFGARNLGDDGLLVDWLGRFRKELEQSGAIADILYNGADPLLEFVEAEALRPLIGRLVPKQELPKLRPRDYRALIAPGGSLLQDSTSLRSLLFYLGSIYRFAAAKVPVFMLNQGIGPLRSAPARFLTPRVLALSKLISLRDRSSYDWARQQLSLIAHRELRLSCDPLLAGRLAIEDLRLQEEAAGPVCVLVPKSISAVPDSNEYRSHLSAQQRLLSHLDSVTDRRADALALHAGQDSDIVDQIVDSIGGCFLDPFKYEPTKMTSLLAEAAAVVSYRLHGLILAAAYGVPGLGVSYDPKVRAFCEEAGLPCISTDDVLRGRYEDPVRRLWDNRETVKLEMIKRRSVMLKRLEESEARFAALLAEALK